MISLEQLNSYPDRYKKLLLRKNFSLDLNLISSFSKDRKELITKSDNYKQRRNYVSKKIGDEKRKPLQEEIIEMRNIGEKIKISDNSLNQIQEKINDYLLTIPNIPSDDVPYGNDDSQNIEVKRFGEAKINKHSKPHWEIGSDLGIIDLPSAAVISGSRFYILKGYGAKLQRSIISWMLDTHV